jgi:hypothetical protein
MSRIQNLLLPRVSPRSVLVIQLTSGRPLEATGLAWLIQMLGYKIVQLFLFNCLFPLHVDLTELPSCRSILISYSNWFRPILFLVFFLVRLFLFFRR